MAWELHLSNAINSVSEEVEAMAYWRCFDLATSRTYLAPRLDRELKSAVLIIEIL